MTELLTKYISFCEEFYGKSFMIVLDKHLTAIFVGEGFLNVTQRSKQDTLGKNLFQTAQIPPENIEPSLACFEKAISEKRIVSVMITNLLHMGIDMHFMAARIKPVCYPNNDDIMAIEFEFYKMNWQTAMNYLLNVVEIHNSEITIPHEDSLLSQRENEVAFLLFYCKNTTEIANVISKFHQKSISDKTIHNVINNNLYTKFSVNNRDSLLIKLKDYGYDKKIPNTLLRNQFIDLS